MGVKGIKAGRAYVEVLSDDTKLVRSIKGIGAKFEALGSKVANVGSGLTRVGAGVSALGAAVVGPIAAGVKKFSEMGDAIQKLGVRTDASAEFLSELGFAAEQSGTSLDQVGAALFRMNRRIANATSATGPAVRALAELGIEARALNQLSTEKRFLALSDALAGMSDKTRAAQLGFEIFGDSFKQIQPLISQGATGIRKLQMEAKQLGLTLSTDDAEAAAKLADAMNRVGTTFKAAFVKIGAAVGPTITGIADRIAGITASVGRWIDQNRPLVLQIAKVGAAVLAIGGAMTGIGVAVTALGGAILTIKAAVITVLPYMTAGFAVAAVKIGAVVAGVTALGAGIAYVLNKAGLLMPAFNFIKRSVARIGETFSQTFGGILDAMQSGKFMLAAKIGWEGVKLVTLQGTQQVLKAVEHLWNNAGSITYSYFKAMVSTYASVFKRLPGIALKAIKGGLSIQGAIREAFAGVMTSGKLDISASLDPAIQRAQQRLGNLTARAQAPRPGQGQATGRPVGPPRGGGAGNDPRMLQSMANQERYLRQLVQANGLG